jgi:hypothetical protein
MQIPTQNGEMKVLFKKFHRRINLMALLVTILGSRNKKNELKILKFGVLRVPPIQILTKKDSSLCFVKKISPWNKSEGTFANYIWVQDQKHKLKVLKFDILRLPPIQITTKNGGNLSFEKRIGKKTAQSILKNLAF